MNTSIRRTALVAASLPLFAASFAAHAELRPSQSDATFDACVKAFVATKFENEPRYSIVANDATHYDPQASVYRITLAAKDKQSGKKLGGATCVVDRDAGVLKIEGRSYQVASAQPVLRAR
jgi:hypothetical protein